MTLLDALAVQVQDARGVLRCRIDELAESLSVIRAEAAIGAPLSLQRAHVKLAAVAEAQEILRARETAERRATAARLGVGL